MGGCGCYVHTHTHAQEIGHDAVQAVQEAMTDRDRDTDRDRQKGAEPIVCSIMAPADSELARFGVTRRFFSSSSLPQVC